MDSKITRRKFIQGASATAIAFSAGATRGETANTGPSDVFSDADGGKAAIHLVSAARVPRSCRIRRPFFSLPYASDAIPISSILRIVRPLDLLDVTLLWNNVKFHTEIKRYNGITYDKWLYPMDSADARLTIVFPPQHLVEQAYAGTPTDIDNPVSARSACSRLVFDVTGDHRIPYTMSGLLDWGRFDMKVAALPRVSTAVEDVNPDWNRPGVEGTKPAPDETAIVLPWGLWLSPSRHERWVTPQESEDDAREQAGPWELWRAELTSRSPSRKPTLRVVYADKNDPPEFVGKGGLLPGPVQRVALYRQTGIYIDVPDPADPKKKKYSHPKAITVNRCALASPGAYAKFNVEWSPEELERLPWSPTPELPNGQKGTPIRIDEWVQEDIWGRDQYVKISSPGYCAPFGHATSLVHIRKRRIEKIGGREFYALLINKWYCVVREPVLTYPLDDKAAQPLACLERGTCLKRVELSPLKTPFLWPVPIIPGQGVSPLSPADSGDTVASYPQWMWLEKFDANGNPSPDNIFSFKVKAVDWQDQYVEFQVPMLWVPEAIGEEIPSVVSKMADIAKIYRDSSYTSYRTANLNGQRIAFLPPSAAVNGGNARDNSVEVKIIEWDIQGETFPTDSADGLSRALPAADAWPQRFYPLVEKAEVQLDHTVAFQEPNQAQSLPVLRYFKGYLNQGVSASTGSTIYNGNEIYATIENSATLAFDSNHSGGLLAPNFATTLLSRKFGPYAAPPATVKAMGGKIPGGSDDGSSNFSSEIFKDVGTLLGAVGLDEIVADVANAFEQVDKIPKFISQTLKQIDTAREDIKQVVDTVLNAIKDMRAEAHGYTSELIAGLDEYIYIEGNGILERWRMLLLEEQDALRTLQGEIKKALPELPGVQDGANLLEKFSHDLRCLASAMPLDPAEYEKVITDRATAVCTGALSQYANSLAEAGKRYYATSGFNTELQALKKQSPIFMGKWQATFYRVQQDVHDILYTAFLSTFQSLPTSQAQMQAQAQADYFTRIICNNDTVLAEIRGAWKVRNNALNKICERIKTSSNEFLKSAKISITDFQNKVDGKKQVWDGFVEAQSKSFVQLQQHLMTEIKKVQGEVDQIVGGANKTVLEWQKIQSVDPEVFFSGDQGTKGLQGIIQQAVSYLDQFRDFPFAGLIPLQDELQQLSDQLKEAPEKFLADSITIVHEIEGIVKSLTGALSGQSSTRLHAFGRSTTPVEDFVKSKEAELLNQIKNALLAPAQAVVNQVRAAKSLLIATLPTQGSFPSLTQVQQDQIWQKVGPVVASLTADINDYWTGEIETQMQVLENWPQNIYGRISDFADSLVVNYVNGLAAKIDGIYASILDQAQIIQKLEDAAAEALAALPKSLTLQLDWNPDLVSNSIFEPQYNGTNADFQIHSRIEKSLVPSEITQPPSMTVEGALTNFRLHLLPSIPVVKVGFTKVSFKSVNGGSPKVEVEIGGVEFDAALKYLADLAKQLSPDNGFFIELVPGGISAGFRFTLPNIETGGFNLFGLSFSVALQLNFNGAPMLIRVAVCERSRPFLLTSGPYGGAGFFALYATPKGVHMIEASFEFGADVAIDIGVATGRGMVNAGVYFSISENDTKLMGFVHACGELNVLNLINLLQDFYLGLGYERRDNQTYAVGEAIVKVEIDFFMFSISVDLHYRKEIQGSGSSPQGPTPSNSEGGDDSSSFTTQNLFWSQELRQVAPQRLSQSTRDLPVYKPSPFPAAEKIQDFITVRNNWGAYRRCFCTNFN